MTGIGEGTVFVYTADTAVFSDEELFREAYGIVSPERRKKTDRLRFEKDKYLSLGAACLLMWACRDFGVDCARETVITDANGKPGFAKGFPAFNLSHSGNRAMCAMARFPVGCDVEGISSADVSVAERYFCGEEARAILSREGEAARRDAFIRLWTLKESFMKCTGLGFALPMDRFCVTAGDGVTVSGTPDSDMYRFFERDPLDGYRYAVCVRSGKEELRKEDVKWEDVPIDRALIGALAEEKSAL